MKKSPPHLGWQEGKAAGEINFIDYAEGYLSEWAAFEKRLRMVVEKVKTGEIKLPKAQEEWGKIIKEFIEG